MSNNVVSETKYITNIEHLENLTQQQRVSLSKVADQYSFRANTYYLSLINWDDPNDPIRRVIIPQICELDQWGRLDPSDEQSYTKLQGLEHKYDSTALLLVSSVCGGICRYCFRKRVFIDSEKECLQDIDSAMDYIKTHQEITNVLLTGGDPLVLSTAKLEDIIGRLSEIDHVRIIRIGTRMPVFQPSRIVEDQSLLDMLSKYNTPRRTIYIMTHFVHSNELSDLALKAIMLLHKTGVEIANQTPLIRGVNDNPEALANLLSNLSFVGVVPYYIFQCRPAIGNKAYAIPIEEGYNIVEQAKAKVSGLAKRVRFVMSHSTGKIEIVGVTDECIYLKYHRAAEDQNNGRFLVFKRNPKAYWLDDYDEIIKDYPVDKPYRSYGPE